jgi:hypothetical protein
LNKIFFVFLLLFSGSIQSLRADIDNLTFLGHNEVNPYHLMDAEVVGNRAYISNGLGTGLEAYDISNPFSPVRIYQDGPATWRCQSFGDTLLVTFCRRSGVLLYNISGSSPIWLGQYDPPGNLEALEGGAVIANMLYVAAHQNGIYVIDISNPTNPQKIDEFLPPGAAAWNVVAVDSFLFVANGRFGLCVIGIEGGLHLVSELLLPGLANDIDLDGNIAAISLGVHGFATVDISNPHNPMLLDTISTDGCVWGIGIAHHQVISGSWRVMELFDISDPNNIARIGWDNTKTWAHGADVRDDSLIAVADWTGMSCYEIRPDPDPDIDVYPQVIDFGPVSTTKDSIITVRNTGSVVLNVSSISTPSGISVNPNSFSVQPGDSQLVTATASGSGNVFGNIVYYSNDPDEPSWSQEVYKNNTGYPQVGSLAPDFTLYGSDGQWHTLSNYRGKVVFLEFGGAW